MSSSYQATDEERGASTNYQNAKVVEVIDENKESPLSSSTTTNWRYLIFSVVLAASLGFLVTSRTSYSSLWTGFNDKKVTLSSSSYVIDVSASIAGYDPIVSTSMLPWDAVLEPYKTNTLTISSFEIDGTTIDVDDDEYDVAWTIGNDISLTGSSATVQIDELGVYSSTITLTKSKTTYSYDFLIAVKYVRREIRDLSDDDRNTFLDALYTTYTVNGAEGRDTYGAKYKDASEVLYRHLNGAGRTDCDHWHDGAGLITHHMAYTLEVEQSLQTIDPSISMPYWEYGMDSYLYQNWYDSPIFGADWFGEANPINGDHYINDGGRWAGLKMPSASPYSDWNIADEGSLKPFTNAYGLMRGPWNNNPTETLGRHNTTFGSSQYDSMPSCSSLQSCFLSSSFSDISDCLNGATHGPVHILIGGAWDDESTFEGEDAVQGLQNPDKVLFFKVLWRMGYTRCPSSCDDDGTDHTNCKCSVPQEYIDEIGAKTILENTYVYYPLENYLKDADDATYLKYLRAVEDPGVTGEMFSSGASFDPTFWPLHGAMERLLGLKRILVSEGVITDFDGSWGWPDFNKYSGAAYLYGKCDWSGVASTDDLTLPTCELGTICNGHNEGDELEFSNFLGNDETYTNSDFYEFMHPWNDSLPYVYDSYDFDYCSDDGYPFYSLTGSQPVAKRERQTNSNNQGAPAMSKGSPM